MNKKNRPALFLLRRGGVIEHEKQFRQMISSACAVFACPFYQPICELKFKITSARYKSVADVPISHSLLH